MNINLYSNLIRPCSCSQDKYAALVNIHNSLNIVWPEAPRSPQSIYQRWAAIEDGGLVGFASYNHP